MTTLQHVPALGTHPTAGRNPGRAETRELPSRATYDLPVIRWLGSRVQARTFSPDGRYFVTGDWEGTVRFWPMELVRHLLK